VRREKTRNTTFENRDARNSVAPSTSRSRYILYYRRSKNTKWIIVPVKYASQHHAIRQRDTNFFLVSNVRLAMPIRVLRCLAFAESNWKKIFSFIISSSLMMATLLSINLHQS
jgi:hypothetical protein